MQKGLASIRGYKKRVEVQTKQTIEIKIVDCQAREVSYRTRGWKEKVANDVGVQCFLQTWFILSPTERKGMLLELNSLAVELPLILK